MSLAACERSWTALSNGCEPSVAVDQAMVEPGNPRNEFGLKLEDLLQALTWIITRPPALHSCVPRNLLKNLGDARLRMKFIFCAV